MEYAEAVKRPFSDLKKLLIGILLSILPIVNFLSVGYSIEAARLTLTKKKNLPEWKDWKDLFIHGLFVTIIGLIFLAPAVIVGIAGLGFGLLSGLLQKSILEGLETGGPMIIAALLLLAVAVYVAPMSFMLYAKTYKFKDAFNFSELLKKILTGKYVIAWLVSVVLGVVFSILGIIPVVGMAAGSFISGVISMTLFAQAYLEIK